MPDKRYSIRPGLDDMVCNECGSLVAVEQGGLHDKWHKLNSGLAVMIGKLLEAVELLKEVI